MDNVKYNLLKDVCISNGGKLLTKNSTEVNTNTKLKYSCKEGHKWETTYHSVIKGTWCDKCKRIEYFEKVRQRQSNKILTQLKPILKNRQGKLLKGEYHNQQSKFQFECKEAHVFETRPDLIIQRGSWCNSCSRKEKLEKERKINEEKTLNDLYRVVKKNKGEILNGEYINIKSKFIFKCKEGHTWETAPYLIIKGHWCGKCSNKIVIDKQRGNIESVLKYIQEKKGKYISGEYINQYSKIIVECDKGHRWNVNSNSLLSKKSWCRECLGTQKRNIDEMIIIGKDRGGKCLSKEYVNDYTKLEWECCEGHVFWSSPNNIKHGKWCPECSTGFYERICRFYFEKIFQKKFLKVRPVWLKNPKTKKNFEIDGYNDVLKIGFEHQGSQHYDDKTYYSKPNIFDNDILKKMLCIDNGVILIEIPELITLTKLNKLKSFIYKELRRLKIKPTVPETELYISNYELYTYTRTKERKSIELSVEQKLKTHNFKVLNFMFDGIHKVDVECSNKHNSTLLIRNIINNKVKCKFCKF
jgi:hypothetical protein